MATSMPEVISAISALLAPCAVRPCATGRGATLSTGIALVCVGSFKHLPHVVIQLQLFLSAALAILTPSVSAKACIIERLAIADVWAVGRSSGQQNNCHLPWGERKRFFIVEVLARA